VLETKKLIEASTPPVEVAVVVVSSLVPAVVVPVVVSVASVVDVEVVPGSAVVASVVGADVEPVVTSVEPEVMSVVGVEVEPVVAEVEPEVELAVVLVSSLPLEPQPSTANERPNARRIIPGLLVVCMICP
jgi:hypothetical protein